MQDKKKHILFLSNHLRGPRGYAGARSWHQSYHLSNEFDLTVVIPGVDPVTSKKVEPASYEGLPDNVVVLKGMTVKNNRDSKLYRALFFISAMLSQFYLGLRTRNIDLVLCMSLPVTLLFISFLLSKIRNVPFIVDVRDLPFETAKEVNYLRDGLALKFFRWIESTCLRAADAVITNSPRYVTHIINKGVDSSKITYAPIGYDDFPEPSSSYVDSWRSKLITLFDNPPSLLILYSGTLGFAFPLGDVLEAAKALNNKPSIGFIILGDGQMLDFYKDQSNRYNLNMIFLGRLDKSDVSAICRAVDVCLYPSAKGEFSSSILGNKIFDYLGAEKPIIYIGDNSAVSDVIWELQAGVVIPFGKTDLLTQTIVKMSDDTSLLQSLSCGAASYRQAGYLAKDSAEKLKRVISSILRVDVHI